ncbi:helix-turn-helix transcriptional regulator [Amycolatopsis sp. lyj-112]|uniref:helix-turn-helix transcriptional regulator n=1 Tax=Amycolatopsis sp. lyj-112 TaxID=2789288 RepID=UPI00397BEB69
MTDQGLTSPARPRLVRPLPLRPGDADGGLDPAYIRCAFGVQTDKGSGKKRETMTDRSALGIRVAVYTADPLTRSGLVGMLATADGLEVLPSDGRGADVLVAAEDPGEHELPVLQRAVAEQGAVPGVLIAGRLPTTGCDWAVSAGVRSLLPHRVVRADRLINEIVSAHTASARSPRQLAAGYDLFADEPKVPSMFDEREIRVLRLIADGLDTAEISTEMGYSQRTIKNILHQAQHRLALRNRAHAVAAAIRAGLI